MGLHFVEHRKLGDWHQCNQCVLNDNLYEHIGGVWRAWHISTPRFLVKWSFRNFGVFRWSTFCKNFPEMGHFDRNSHNGSFDGSCRLLCFDQGRFHTSDLHSAVFVYLPSLARFFHFCLLGTSLFWYGFISWNYGFVGCCFGHDHNHRPPFRLKFGKCGHFLALWSLLPRWILRSPRDPQRHTRPHQRLKSELVCAKKRNHSSKCQKRRRNKCVIKRFGSQFVTMKIFKRRPKF